MKNKIKDVINKNRPKVILDKINKQHMTLAKTGTLNSSSGEEKENKKEDIDDLELNEDNENEANFDYAPEDIVLISKTKIAFLKKLLRSSVETNQNLINILSSLMSPEEEERIQIGQIDEEAVRLAGAVRGGSEGRIIEGVFDGESMIGPDGKQYSVPANYASKSKLVEGDILKLTITGNGTFLYKQIGPIERSRVVGKLEQNTSGNFIASAGNKKWRVLTASVTYFKGDAGDEVVVLVPKAGESKWAAVENIVKKK